MARAAQVVRASPRAFALLWLTLLTLHMTAVVFFGGSALFYNQLEGTYLDRCLQWFKIFKVEPKWYPAIAALHALVALPHAVIILKMLGASIRHRSLAFTFSTRKKNVAGGPTIAVDSVIPFDSPTVQDGPRWTVPDRVGSDTAWWRPRWPAGVVKAYSYFFDRKGVFGVDGRHFHLIMFLRELVELTLQTAQAYRMSYYLPRMLLNRSYVSFLVINCWVTPIIYSVFKRSEAKKRLLSLVCDCALDFTTSVIIPCTILATYIGQYDWEVQGFGAMMWYDDVWFVHVKNEFQILLVVSWQDMLMRLVFSMGMLLAMGDIKDLVELHRSTSPTKSAIRPLLNAARTSVRARIRALSHPNAREASALSMRVASLQQRLRTASADFIASKYGGYAAKSVYGLLFLWGAIILGFHISAELFPALPQCLLQVRPWGKTSPACTLVVANCYALGISGLRSELDAQWEILDRASVVRILVRHCTAFEMPPVLQEFSRITSLKVYNSTIAAWDDGAALTAARHPHLEGLYFARVNMTNGELPPGLLSPDFPPSIFSIQFCVSNLRSLPPDLDMKWSKHMMIYFEHSAFTEVPDVMMRLLPRYISFYGTPLREVPSEMFAIEPVLFLNIGRTQIKSLPATVPAVSTTLLYVYMPGTGVSYFPQWFDGFVTPWIDVGGEMYLPATPYCDQLDAISNGSRLAFDVHEGEASTDSLLSVLMDASAANLPLIQAIAKCSQDTDVGFFELAYEDKMSGLNV